jgi:hypothetical protein
MMKKELTYTVCGNVNNYHCYEILYGGSSKKQTATTKI